MLYFAYGSNMSEPRIQARIPSAEFVTVACLEGYRLAFSKPGNDHSGKCDVINTGEVDDRVFGVVYRIASDEKQILDRYEGLGVDYTEEHVLLKDPAGDMIEAYLYVATEKAENLQPYHWYKKHVLHGAQEAGLPEEYIGLIRCIASMDDPDSSRNLKELSIYGDTDERTIVSRNKSGKSM